MTKLKPGDRVNCRIKDNVIVSPYQGDHEETRTFEVIGKDPYGYYLFVPNYMFLKDSVMIDDDACAFLLIEDRFIGEQVIYINENMICKVSSQIDGCACTRCREFFHMAEPNQENGTLICWQCRNNPYR